MDESGEQQRWIATILMDVRERLGHLQATTHGNREAMYDATAAIHMRITDFRTELSERMDRMEGEEGWLKRIPWVAVLRIGLIASLLLTGHLTVPQLKSLLGMSGAH